MSATIETQFANWLDVRSNMKVKDGIRYVRCNADTDVVLALLEENSIPVTQSNAGYTIPPWE